MSDNPFGGGNPAGGGSNHKCGFGPCRPGCPYYVPKSPQEAPQQVPTKSPVQVQVAHAPAPRKYKALYPPPEKNLIKIKFEDVPRQYLWDNLREVHDMDENIIVIELPGDKSFALPENDFEADAMLKAFLKDTGMKRARHEVDVPEMLKEEEEE